MPSIFTRHSFLIQAENAKQCSQLLSELYLHALHTYMITCRLKSNQTSFRKACSADNNIHENSLDLSPKSREIWVMAVEKPPSCTLGIYLYSFK